MEDGCRISSVAFQDDLKDLSKSISTDAPDQARSVNLDGGSYPILTREKSAPKDDPNCLSTLPSIRRNTFYSFISFHAYGFHGSLRITHSTRFQVHVTEACRVQEGSASAQADNRALSLRREHQRVVSI